MSNTNFLSICLLIASAYIATDIYIPSLPNLTIYFSISSNLVQYTISVYLFALSMTQLIFGPLSDQYGRKPILLIGTVIGCLGTITCFFSENIYWMIIGRLWQGIGLSALISTPKAIISDRFTNIKLAQYNSYLSVIIPVFLAAALVIGGYLEQYLGWRSTFIFMMIYLVILIPLIWKLPETNNFAIRYKFSFKKAVSLYLSLLMNKSYLRASYNIALGSAGVFTYIITSPFLLQNLAGLEPAQFGWLAIAVLITLIISGLINSLLIHYYKLKSIIVFNAIIMFISGVILLIIATFKLINIFILIFPLLMFLFACMPIITNSYTIALDAHKTKEKSGTSAALLCTIQLLGGGFGSLIIASLVSNGPLLLAYAYILISLMIAIPSIFSKNLF